MKKKEIVKNDIYISISHSSNKFITKEESENFIKDGVYYTFGKNEIGDIYIFDFEKNSILPEVRFLDGFSGGSVRSSGFNMFGPGFLFILFLAGVFVYFSFFNDGGDKSTGNILTSISSDKLTQSSSLVPTLGNLPIYTAPSLSSTTSNITNLYDLEKKSDNNIDKLTFEIGEATNTVRYLTSDLEIKSLKYKSLKSDNDVCITDLEKAKINIIELEKKVSNQIELNLSENQLYMSIGKDIFDRCYLKDSPYCTDYIYKFYKLRK